MEKRTDERKALFSIYLQEHERITASSKPKSSSGFLGSSVTPYMCKSNVRGQPHLDDLHQLVDAAVPGEYGLTQQQLRQHAAGWPDVDVRRVVGGAEDELRGAVVPRADVWHVGLAANQLLGTEGKDRKPSKWQKQFNRNRHRTPLTCRSRTAWGRRFPGRPGGSAAWCLDGKRPANGCRPGCETAGTCRPEQGKTAGHIRRKNKTFDIWRRFYLHINDGNDALGFVEVPGDPVDRLRDKIQHQVEVNLVFLSRIEKI